MEWWWQVCGKYELHGDDDDPGQGGNFIADHEYLSNLCDIMINFMAVCGNEYENDVIRRSRLPRRSQKPL